MKLLLPIAEIRQSPVSQLVKLGESATFHCSATGVGGSSFDLVLYNPLFHPDPIYITSDTPTLPDWLRRTIRDDYEVNDQGGYSDIYTATVTIEGSYFTNGTTLRCRVFRFSMSGSVYSDTAELMVIGESMSISDQASRNGVKTQVHSRIIGVSLLTSQRLQMR